MFINYSDLPNFTNLFLDYIYEFDKVKEFYLHNFRNQEEYAHKFNEISNSKRILPTELSKIISNQYANIKTSKRTLNNINSLGNANALAIVTGQQLTIFGGPLYTFYKIITAIKLCSQLKENFVDYNFIPVFWLEGDDHDFNEVRTVNIFNSLNEIQKIEYPEAIDSPNEFGSVGNIKLKEEIDETLNKLKSSLRQTDFRDELISLLSSSYNSMNSFKSAFKSLLINFFDEYGLVIIDPQDSEFKKLLIPVFEKEIKDYFNHTQVILKRSAVLEEKYHAQVKVKPINLFLSDESKRYLIEPDESGYRLKNKRKKFSQEELLKLLYTNPELFSPNVLLRPVCQDFILPTAFYIGGPSEISYFAQLIPYYSIYKISQPFIYPRASITLIEKNINSLIEKYGLNILNIFHHGKELIPETIQKFADVNTSEMFLQAQNNVKSIIDNLKTNLINIDPSVEQNLEKLQEKLLQNIDSVKTKIENTIIKKNEILDRQLNKIFNNILPESNLQEREINFSYYVNKYGTDFINYLFNEISVTKFEHQIIIIES
jgi:bacillithiol biosynthesis cysteine-adding enzyme BshC